MMTSERQYLGEIDRYEEGEDDVFAQIQYWEEGKFAKGAGLLIYPHQLVPPRGSFGAARYDVSVEITREPQGIEREVSPSRSIAEFEAELTDIDPEYYRFTLRDTTNRTSGGSLMLTPDYVPDWVREEGDQCYPAIQLEYNHGRTKRETDYSEEKIESLRGQGEEMYDRLFS